MIQYEVVNELVEKFVEEINKLQNRMNEYHNISIEDIGNGKSIVSIG